MTPKNQKQASDKQVGKIILSYLKSNFAYQAGIVMVIIIVASSFINRKQYNLFVAKEEALLVADIENIKENHKAGSTLGLPDSTSCTKKAFEILYKDIFSSETNSHLKSRTEVAILLTKLDFVKKVFTSHPEEENRSFRIIELDEKIAFGVNNTDVSIESRYKARYEANVFPSEEMKFDFFLVAGYDPPDKKNLGLSIINLVTKKPFKDEDIAITPIGSKSDVSHLYKVCLTAHKNDLDDKILDIQVNSPIIHQSIPFSFQELHIHRYLRGVDFVRYEFKFATPSFVNLLSLNRKEMAISNLNTDDYLIVSKKGDNESGFSNVVFEIPSPNSPLIFTFLQFWKGDIFSIT
ncbi:MAG: hypothetical protein L6425_03150 [Candidatus Aminicenantes bacterium]|nr:hypothetical protein [Candidatus Aminicenantes bacterium]